MHGSKIFSIVSQGAHLCECRGTFGLQAWILDSLTFLPGIFDTNPDIPALFGAFFKSAEAQMNLLHTLIHIIERLNESGLGSFFLLLPKKANQWFLCLILAITTAHIPKLSLIHMEAVRPSWRFTLNCQSMPVDFPRPINCFHEAIDLFMGVRRRERVGVAASWSRRLELALAERKQANKPKAY